ncbi:MFS transporter [Bailinhaonella thermotolerans]|uniref:MFS transporter n=1 Tax=Bailinhaonella thermotolerans TaxID=1070861 RepID=A0A3A4AZ80_9ACTN|nr:MFS transporter [Bailinhaonella thermotolerans]RJL34433.1 MFS transporter [Bailinhaonella thermotolerans]
MLTITTGTGVDRRDARDAGVNRWAVLALLCFSLLLIAVDATVLHVAVPALAKALAPTSVEQLWIIDVYSLVVAPLLLTFGTLGDRYGRKRLILLGYAVFGLASLSAAFAATPLALILSRAALGVGGAMIMPSTLSLIRQVFTDRQERALALGVWSAVAAAGAAVGPLIGGVLVEHFRWGVVFLINLPLLVPAFFAALRLLPESRDPDPHRWDWQSAVLSTLGVLGLAFGVKVTGSGDPRALLALAAGVALLWVFVRRQRRLAHPLLDVGLFADRGFSVGVACVMLAIFALVGLQLMLAQYLQLVLGDSPLEAGARMLPLMLAAMAGGLVGARLLHRVGVRAAMGGGLALTALSLLPTLWFGQTLDAIPLALCFTGIGFGVEVALLAASDTILAAAPEERAGGAAGIEETAYELGAGLGVAVLGTVTTAVYAPGLRALPGVPAEDMSEARESLSVAAHVAARLPAEPGHRLLDAAREAFVSALHSTVLVSLALLSLTALLAVLAIPRRTPARPAQAPRVPRPRPAAPPAWLARRVPRRLRDRLPLPLGESLRAPSRRRAPHRPHTPPRHPR